MVKELIQKLMKEPEARLQMQSGQLQLAGMTSWERSAFNDVVNDWKPENNVRQGRVGIYWL